MNAISSLNSLYSSYAIWSAPVAPPSKAGTDLGPMDAYDISGVSDPLEGLPQDAPAPAESPEAEGGAAPMVEENGFTPQATDIPGEMWFFSAGSGCVDGGASDWGGLAGLD